MPLQIIRQDITKISCDAIVNPSNTHLYPTGGTDLAIHKAAGKKLFDECQKVLPAALCIARSVPPVG